MCAARNGTKQRVSCAENRVHFAIHIFIYKLFRDSANGWWALCDMKCRGTRAGANMDGYSCVVANAINIPELCIIATLLLSTTHSEKCSTSLKSLVSLPFSHSFSLYLALISHYSLLLSVHFFFFKLSLFGIQSQLFYNFCGKSITQAWSFCFWHLPS